METLGAGAALAVARVTGGDSRATQLRKLALLARRESDGLPVRFDRDVDLEIPRRLISFRPMTGPLAMRRAMRDDERDAVQARAAALELALEPYRDEAASEINATIGAMLAGFRSMRQQGDDVESTIAITRAVLREFPFWAITQACLKISRRETQCDPRFAPNDAEIVEVVRSIVKPYRETFTAASALLSAVVENIEPRYRGSTRETQQAPPVSVGDGNHGARVAADLERRRMQRENGSAPAEQANG